MCSAHECHVDENDAIGVDPDEAVPPDSHPLDKLDFVDIKDDAQKLREAKEIVHRRHKVFSRTDIDVGLTKLIKHDIKLKPGTTPRADAPRSMPLEKREIANKFVSDLEEAGIVEPAVSPWYSFPVLVAKKCCITGNWLPNKHFAIDFRINEVTEFDAQLIPHIGEVIDAMQGCVWFSKLDIQNAFNLIELME